MSGAFCGMFAHSDADGKVFSGVAFKVSKTNYLGWDKSLTGHIYRDLTQVEKSYQILIGNLSKQRDRSHLELEPIPDFIGDYLLGSQRQE